MCPFLYYSCFFLPLEKAVILTEGRILSTSKYGILKACWLLFVSPMPTRQFHLILGESLINGSPTLASHFNSPFWLLNHWSFYLFRRGLRGGADLVSRIPFDDDGLDENRSSGAKCQNIDLKVRSLSPSVFCLVSLILDRRCCHIQLLAASLPPSLRHSLLCVATDQRVR